MAQTVTQFADLKTAAVLAGAFGLSGAITVPFLLAGLPPEARDLPLPLPLFSLALMFQLLVVYGLFAFAGLRLARQRGLDPAPLLSACWLRQPTRPVLKPIGIAIITGLACGIFLVGAVAAIRFYAPHTLPALLHPQTLWAALLASVTASIGEEILCRLLLLSLMLRLLPTSRGGTIAALLTSALFFGALHAPGWVFVSGGLQHVPPLSWVWVIGLNGLLGVVYGILFVRQGIGGAIVGHFCTDLVWHVMPHL